MDLKCIHKPLQSIDCYYYFTERRNSGLSIIAAGSFEYLERQFHPGIR